MAAVILQHPLAPVQFDPREPPHPALGPASEDLCSACGAPTRRHVGVTGAWLGCDVAAYVQRRSDLPRNPERWNDPWPQITARVRAAMVDGECGPRMETDMACYDSEAQLDIAAAIVRIVMTAAKVEGAK